MRRREFMTLIGGAAVLPRVVRAQQASPLPRVGLVSIGADPGDPVVFRPFLEQLRELGYIEGRNITLERRFAAGRDELIGDFVADLVQRKVDIIVVTGDRESLTAKNATSSIPIVTIVVTDPIRTGLAASLARPGATSLASPRWTGASTASA
jgi:putative ABC transport system substrate-binding protein